MHFFSERAFEGSLKSIFDFVLSVQSVLWKRRRLLFNDRLAGLSEVQFKSVLSICPEGWDVCMYENTS